MKHKCTGWAIVATMERPDGTWYTDTITEIDDDTLDAAVEVIQDFLNCDPMEIGKLQGNTYDTIYNIEREINESNS